MATCPKCLEQINDAAMRCKHCQADLPLDENCDRSTPPFSSPNDFDRLKFIRDEIRFEHTQLANRISAYLASQAFLATAFAISGQAAHRGRADYMIFAHLALPMVGVLVSHWIHRAVEETQSRIEMQRDLIIHDSSSLKPLLQLLRPEFGKKSHNRSLLYSTRLPLLFGIFWFLVLGWGVALALVPAIREVPSNSQQPIQVGQRVLVETWPRPSVTRSQ